MHFPCGTKIQTLLFDREHFTAAQAKRWARAHGFTVEKTHVTKRQIRIRQYTPGRFVQSTFRTIALRSGVEAVTGCLKGAEVP